MTKVLLQISGERIRSKIGADRTGHMLKVRLNWIAFSCPPSNSKWIKDLNMKKNAKRTNHTGKYL